MGLSTTVLLKHLTVLVYFSYFLTTEKVNIKETEKKVRQAIY